MWKETRGSVWGYVELSVPVGHKLTIGYVDAKQLQIPQLKNGLQRLGSLQHIGGS